MVCRKLQELRCHPEIITDRTQKGNQFVKGYGGIGGLMRYRVDFHELASFEDNDTRYSRAKRT
jgi:peptide chain release factor subunit 1